MSKLWWNCPTPLFQVRDRVVCRIKSKAKEVIRLRWQIKEQLWKYKLHLIRAGGSKGKLWASTESCIHMLMFCSVSGQKHLPPMQWRYIYRNANTKQKNIFLFFWIKKLYILRTVFMCEFLCLHGDSKPEERAGCSERSFLPPAAPISDNKTVANFQWLYIQPARLFSPYVSPSMNGRYEKWGK